MSHHHLVVLRQRWKLYLDKTTIWIRTRWACTSFMLLIFMIRVIASQGWYISAYALGIHLLNLLIGFLTPQKDPETDAYILPVRYEERVVYDVLMMVFISSAELMNIDLSYENYPNSTFGSNAHWLQW